MNTDQPKMTPSEFCRIHEACPEGARFALSKETMAQVWDECPRVDWLIWIMRRTGEAPDRKALRLFACWCVRETPISGGRKVWDLLTDERSRNAVIVAERFANGEATDEELAVARRAAADAADAADAAAAAADAADAAADAADAAAAAADAADAADAAAAAADAADAAAYAAYAAAAAADAADAADARIQARAFQADHFRTIFTNPFKT